MSENTQKLGNYMLINVVGSGGMGTVYKAYDPSLDRYVAIKVISPELSKNAEYIGRFKTEAQLLAKIIHPNILQIYSIGEENGCFYYAMELISPPRSLRTEIELNKNIPAKKACDYILQIISGLNAAYESHSIIHGDLKPVNFLITPEDKMKIVDFGLASYRGKALSTQSGEHILGTPAYMSPEQITGSGVDCRSDMYSLGICFYEMLTGRLPYESKDINKVMEKHVNVPLPDIRKIKSDVPESLCKIIEKMTAKKAQQRYSDYKVLYKDIKEAREIISGKYAAIMNLKHTTVNNQKKRIGPAGSIAEGIKRPKMPVFQKLVLAGTASLLIAGIAIYSIKTIMKPKPREDIVIVKKDPGEEFYNTVLAYQQEHPKEFGTIIKNFENLIKNYPDSKWTEVAQYAIRKLKQEEEKLRLAQHVKYKNIVEEIENLLKKEKYKSALETLNKFESCGIEEKDIKAAIPEYMDKVKRYIAGAYEKLNNEAEILCENKKFDEALRLQEKITAWGIESYVLEAGKSIKKIKDSKELFVRQETEKRYAQRIAALNPEKLIDARKYKEFTNLYQNLKKEFPEEYIARDIDKKIKEVESLEAMLTKLASEINKTPSSYQHIKFNGGGAIDGRIIFCDINTNRVTIEFKDEKGNTSGKTEIKWSELSINQIYNLLAEYNKNSAAFKYDLNLYAKLHRIKNERG